MCIWFIHLNQAGEHGVVLFSWMQKEKRCVVYHAECSHHLTFTMKKTSHDPINSEGVEGSAVAIGKPPLN